MDTKTAKNSAEKMLKDKNLDAVCLNILKDSSSFGSNTNGITLFTQKEIFDLGNKDKLSLSLEVLQSLKNL